MHDARHRCACAAIGGGCVIVVGGAQSITGTAEVYEEALGRRWRRLPRNLPQSAGRFEMGSAIM
jgi:hypothetical protein